MTRPSTAWLETTLSVLNQAGAQWAESQADDVQAQRKIVAQLIRQLTDGLRLLGLEEANLQPLQILNLALFDLTQGVRNSFFQVRASGREPDSAMRQRTKLFAVALVEWLVEGKMPVRKALELVAREFTRAGHRSHSGREITSNVIKKWRDTSFEGGRRKLDAAVVELHLDLWRERLGERPRTAELSQAFVRRVAAGALKSSQRA